MNKIGTRKIDIERYVLRRMQYKRTARQKYY